MNDSSNQCKRQYNILECSLATNVPPNEYFMSKELPYRYQSQKFSRKPSKTVGGEGVGCKSCLGRMFLFFPIV